MTDSADFTAETGDDELDLARTDVEADPADVFEQHQSVPGDDDDYDR